MSSSFNPRRPNFLWKINGNAKNGKKCHRANNFFGEIALCFLDSGHSKTTNSIFWCARTVEYASGLNEYEFVSPVGEWFSRLVLFGGFLPVLSFDL